MKQWYLLFIFIPGCSGSNVFEVSDCRNNATIFSQSAWQGKSEWNFDLHARLAGIQETRGAFSVHNSQEVRIYMHLLLARELALLSNIRSLQSALDELPSAGMYFRRDVTLSSAKSGYVIVVDSEPPIEIVSIDMISNILEQELHELTATRNIGKILGVIINLDEQEPLNIRYDGSNGRRHRQSIAVNRTSVKKLRALFQARKARCQGLFS